MNDISTNACYVKIIVDVFLQQAGAGEFIAMNRTSELHELSQWQMSVPTGA